MEIVYNNLNTIENQIIFRYNIHIMAKKRTLVYFRRRNNGKRRRER